MKKRAEHTFDEHEVDTAKRPYPLAVDDAHRTATAKIAKVDLDTMLRTESGTRPSVTRETIRRHLTASRHDISPPVADAEIDLHARPTIDVFSVIPVPAPIAATTEVTEWPRREGREGLPQRLATPPAFAFEVVRTSTMPPQLAIAPPQDHAPSAPPFDQRPSQHRESQSEAMALPPWLLPAVVLGFVLIVLAASTFGFFVGRMSGH